MCTLAFQCTALWMLIHEGQCAIMCRESLAVSARIDGSAEKERTHCCPQICYPPTAAFNPLSSSTCHLTHVPVMSQPTTNEDLHSLDSFHTVERAWTSSNHSPNLASLHFLPFIDCRILLYAKRLVWTAYCVSRFVRLFIFFMWYTSNCHIIAEGIDILYHN